MKINLEARRNQEKRVVRLMIELYCKKHHHVKEKGQPLCPQCQELLDYSSKRTDCCPFMETKTFCAHCKVHCYKPEMKVKMKEVMRFSGPWMLLHHPVLGLKHVILSMKEKRKES